MPTRFNFKVFLFVKVCVVICGSFISTFSGAEQDLRTGAVEDSFGNEQRTDENDTVHVGDTMEKPNPVEVFSVERLGIQGVDLADLNCTVPAIVRFPPTLFNEEQRENGAVVLNFLFAFYLFGALGYVCCVYFVPSLEITSKMLGIQEDVAGATFMAIGSSAPEFFSSAIGTFVTFDNTGLSAIIGSAAFNVFVIVALCALVAGGKEGLQLSWYPVIRDSVCWVISIVILIIVTSDGLVQWWEGLIMTLCFLGYILIMAYNKPVSQFVVAWAARTNFLPCRASSESPGGAASVARPDERRMEEMSLIDSSTTSGDGWRDEPPTTSSRTPHEQGYPKDDGTTTIDIEDTESESTIPSVFDPPTSTTLYMAWLLGFPVILLLHYTVPDCRMPGIRRRCYPVTFVMSTLWLALFSYLLYWMIEIIGYTLGVSDTIMGYTVLAVGTSVPDAIASVLVARDGFADMAMANIIGSNIFETYICLGFIWFLKSVTSDPAGTPVSITEDGLTVTAVCLLLVVTFMIVAIHNNAWKLDMKVGVIALLMYVAFMAWATLNAEGVFGAAFQGNTALSMPPCPSSLFDL